MIFGTLVDNSNIEKLTEPFFPRKSFLPKFGQNGPKIALKILKNFVMLVLIGNNLKWKKNIFIDISPTYLAKFRVLRNGPKLCQSIKLQDSLKCNIVRKKWIMKYIFMSVNIEVLCKVILSFWLSVTSHAQNNQNKFACLWGMKLSFCLDT